MTDLAFLLTQTVTPSDQNEKFNNPIQQPASSDFSQSVNLLRIQAFNISSLYKLLIPKVFIKTLPSSPRRKMTACSCNQTHIQLTWINTIHKK